MTSHSFNYFIDLIKDQQQIHDLSDIGLFMKDSIKFLTDVNIHIITFVIIFLLLILVRSKTTF